MIYIIFALCALVATFFACRYYAAKTLLVEHEIDKAIARRFSSSQKALELAKLREENVVIRNLLLDLLENEAAFPVQCGNGIEGRFTQDERRQDPAVSRDTGRKSAFPATA